MILQNGPHRQSIDLVTMVRFQFDEFDGRRQIAKIDRKAGVGLLAHKGFAHHLMASVNADYVARNEGGSEEREAHDVVPVKMRHEDIEAMLAGGTKLGDQAVAEFARSRTQVAQHELVAASNQFHATGIAAVCAGYGKWQLIVNKRIDFR